MSFLYKQTTSKLITNGRGANPESLLLYTNASTAVSYHPLATTGSKPTLSGLFTYVTPKRTAPCALVGSIFSRTANGDEYQDFLGGAAGLYCNAYLEPVGFNPATGSILSGFKVRYGTNFPTFNHLYVTYSFGYDVGNNAAAYLTFDLNGGVTNIETKTTGAGTVSGTFDVGAKAATEFGIWSYYTQATNTAGKRGSINTYVAYIEWYNNVTHVATLDFRNNYAFPGGGFTKGQHASADEYLVF